MNSNCKASKQLDAHAHVFHTCDKSIKDARYIPNYNASLDDWLAMLDARSFVGGTLVQPSFLGTDNTRLLASIEEANNRGYSVTGSAVVHPDVKFEKLEKLAAHKIVAVRLNLVERPLPDFKSGLWSAFLEKINSLNLAVEIHLEAARMLPILEDIQERCEAIVLDHYALVENVAQIEHLLGQFDKTNLAIKRSAPYRLPIENENDRHGIVDDLDAYLLQQFPKDQVPSGTDWPHTRFEHLGLCL